MSAQKTLTNNKCRMRHNEDVPAETDAVPFPASYPWVDGTPPHVLLQDMARGVMPADVDNCVHALDFCEQAETVVCHGRAMLIAHMRTLIDDRKGWLMIVREHWAQWGNDQQIDKQARIGDFLLGQRRDRGRFLLLLGCSQDKLASLCRLGGLLDPFLAKGDPRAHTRDVVRARVNAWLKAGGDPGAMIETTRKKTGSRGLDVHPRQMDFMGALFSGELITDDQHRELVASERLRPVNALINGLHLVGVATEKYMLAKQIDPTELEEAIDELDTQRALLLERLQKSQHLLDA